MDAWKQQQAVQLGINIRERRKELGLSQSKLAEGLFSVQTVSLIERGKLNVSPETLAVFAERLNCTVDDLLRMANDLQAEFLEGLLQTALRHKELNQNTEALEAFHTLYTESLAKSSPKYLRESSYHLCLLYSQIGKYSVSNEWGNEALRLLDVSQHLEMAVEMYSNLGRNHYMLGKMWEAYDLFKEGEQLIEQYQYTAEQAGILFYNIAIIKQMLSNWEGCIWYCERALRIFEEKDTVIKIGGAHMMLGVSYTKQERYDKARHHYERSIRILSQTNDLISLARAYHNLGDLELEMGQYEYARKHLLRSLKLKRQAKDISAIPTTLRNLAVLAMREQDFEEARQRLQEGVQCSEQLNNSLQKALCLVKIGDLAQEEGKEEEFISFYSEAIDHLEKLGFSSSLAEAAEKLGEYYLTKGMEIKAVPYLQKATQHYRKLHKKS